MGEPDKPMERALQMEKGGSGGSMASRSLVVARRNSKTPVLPLGELDLWVIGRIGSESI